MPCGGKKARKLRAFRKDALLGLEDEFALGVHFIEAVEVAHAVALFVKGYLAGEAVEVLQIVMEVARKAAGSGPLALIAAMSTL